ncbi:hypothetical protein DMUE_4928 [Dictyocoela muelleri]|nr:hypothetical protein DMUE_4928 [Dictyocoela muelleri]
MYQVINTTEKTLIEQKNINTSVYKKKSSGNRNTQKFCTYHNTNNHDTREFRRMKQIKQKSENTKSYFPQSKSDHHLNSATESTNTLEISEKIHNGMFLLLIDTGQRAHGSMKD